MNYHVILDIIDKINNELNKNSSNLSIKVTCLIETKHQTYQGTYSTCEKDVLVLTHSYLLSHCDDEPRTFTETHIQLSKDDIVAFSYNVITKNILN